MGELEQIDQGGRFTGRFLSRVMAWHGIKMQIALHQSDAQSTAAEKEMKKKRR